MSSYYDRDRRYRAPDGSDHFDAQFAPTAGTMNHVYSHHSNVSEYQASGIPWVHTETVADGDFTQDGAGPNYFDKLVTINFPFVTRWLMVFVHEDQTAIPTAKIGFGINGTSGGATSENYCSTGLTNQVRLELKSKKLYIILPGSLQGLHPNGITVEVIAGLTGVKDFPSTDAAYIHGITSSDYDGTSTDSTGTVSTGDSLSAAVVANLTTSS